MKQHEVFDALIMHYNPRTIYSFGTFVLTQHWGSLEIVLDLYKPMMFNKQLQVLLEYQYGSDINLHIVPNAGDYIKEKKIHNARKMYDKKEKFYIFEQKEVS